MELDGVIAVRLPAQFKRIEHAKPARRPDLKPGFIGDAAGEPDDQNFWAITHAFAFREIKDSSGSVKIPAMLVVSRVADKQSFSSAQLFMEGAVRFSSDPRWLSARRLVWKQKQVSKSLTLFEAEIEAGKQGSNVLVMVDRDNLLEALILGERQVLNAQVAQQLLEDLRSGYRVTRPLEDYFHQINAAVQARADVRRKHYLALLENLQKEELDYTPTPRVVVFNRNLAGQFWWPMFDRSGVPKHFAIAGRLGSLSSDNSSAWRQLESSYANMRLVYAEFEGEIARWKALGSGSNPGARTLALLSDTRWASPTEKQAFAAIEFAFAEGIPELSPWLNALETISRQAEAQGLVQPLSPY